MLKQLSMGAIAALAFETSNAASIQMVLNEIQHPDIGAPTPMDVGINFGTVTLSDIDPSEYHTSVLGTGVDYTGIRYTVDITDMVTFNGVTGLTLPNIEEEVAMQEVFVSNDFGFSTGNITGDTLTLLFDDPTNAMTTGDVFVFDLYNEAGVGVADLELSFDYSVTARDINSNGWTGSEQVFTSTNGFVTIDLNDQPGGGDPSTGTNLPEPNSALLAMIPIIGLVMRRKRTDKYAKR